MKSIGNDPNIIVCHRIGKQTACKKSLKEATLHVPQAKNANCEDCLNPKKEDDD